MSYILEAENIEKQYAGHKALDCVTINIPKNKIYGLLGPNGAGKTTFIRIINQITAPDKGSIYLNSLPLQKEDIKNIGYLPEERGLYKKMKVAELIIYLARLKGMEKNKAEFKMNQWLDKFEISKWKNNKVEELSKGMQQKIQFITTVIHDPKIIILDEPFSGFDPVNAELLKSTIIELKEKVATLILSTHNMNSVEEMCDEITLINKSKVVLQGEVNEIRRRFKKHLFKVIVTEGKIVSDDSVFRIVEYKTISSGIVNIIKANDEITNAQLINYIAMRYNVESFEEMLPSMQEVFIEVVKE